MINLSYCQNEYKKIVFEKVTLKSGEKGMAFNEKAMDLVYKKYIDFDKLKNDFKKIILENKKAKLQIQNLESKDLFSQKKIKDLNIVIEKTNNNHNQELGLIKKQLKKARLNTFKVAGVGAIIIGLIVLSN